MRNVIYACFVLRYVLISGDSATGLGEANRRRFGRS